MRTIAIQAALAALVALAGAAVGCGDGLSAAVPYDGGPPVTDASCPLACGRGQVCEYPGAVGDDAGAGPSTPSCAPMPQACTADPGCGCLWATFCGGAGVGIACSYNQGAGYWLAQCEAN